LQVPTDQRATSIEALRDAMSQCRAHDGLLTFRLLENRQIETELSLVLEWGTPTVEQTSALAARLLRLCRELGLSHHTVWRDVTLPTAERAGGDRS
jgi:hypothetical protein